MHVDDDTGKTIGQYGQTTIPERKATFHTTCVAQEMGRSIKGEAMRTSDPRPSSNTGVVLELGLGSLNVSVACQFCALLSHFLTVYHLVTVVDSCCITCSHVFLLFFTFYYCLSIEFKYSINIAIGRKSAKWHAIPQ